MNTFYSISVGCLPEANMCDFILHKIFKHIEITQEEFSFQIPFLDKMLTGCLEFEVNNKNRYPTETFIY